MGATYFKMCSHVLRIQCYFRWLSSSFRSEVMVAHKFTGHCSAEVAGVTFSDSDSAPVPKFLAILQIWESDSRSDYDCNQQSNRNSPMFLLKKWPRRLLLLFKLNGIGLLFYMTQPISRSTIKAIACSKPAISEN